MIKKYSLKIHWLLLCLTYSSLAMASPSLYFELGISAGPFLMVKNDNELTQALATANNGQFIVLSGQNYNLDREIGAGRVLVAKNLDRMPKIFGKYSFVGEDTTIYGLDFVQHGLYIDANKVKILRSKIHDIGAEIPINIYHGDNVIIAYNEIYNWGRDDIQCGARKGISTQAYAKTFNSPNGSVGIKIYRNYLHDQIGYNNEGTCVIDAEVINVGGTAASGRSQSVHDAYIHHNLIVNALGDDEGIGVKSSYNRIEFNHLKEVRGFNNRSGGHNYYIGNRVENAKSNQFSRSGYNNWSIGEVIDGTVTVAGGTFKWGELRSSELTKGSATMMPFRVHLIGLQANQIHIGVDQYNKLNLDAYGTVVIQSNVEPILGDLHSATNISSWNEAATQFNIPEAIRLTPNEVGPYAKSYLDK
jgi:hypothetical protein